jgi:tRNA dimethylallyltransferase
MTIRSTKSKASGKRDRIVIITGPTASGKTSLSIDVARSLRPAGEIVYADSAAVYRRLDIGTAKPTAEEMAEIPHHLIDVCDIDDDFNAEIYSKAATYAIKEIIKRGKVPIVAGGTGLYIKALVHGLFQSPKDTGKVREDLLDELEEKGLDALYAELESVDRKSAETINPNDKTRIIRALEIYRLTGRPASKIREKHAFKEKIFDPLYIGLGMDRKLLHRRIDLRVDNMIELGIVGEVEEILEKGYSPDCRSLATIGYKEIVSHIKGEIDLETAIGLIKRNTRRLAKRQVTWFKKNGEICWFEYPYDLPAILEKINMFLDR